MNIYPKFPTAEEWQQVIEEAGEIRNLVFFACSARENREFFDSVEHFNDKLAKLRISYYFLQYYYRHPEEEELFDYYVENFYFRYFSLWDFIYHLINEYYRFWVDSGEGPGFKGDVRRRLQKTDRHLSEYLRSVEQDNSDFAQARKYRNTIVHQIFPGEDSIELVRTEWNGKLRTERKEGIPSEVFISNISAVTRLLSRTLELLEVEFNDTDCMKKF